MSSSSSSHGAPPGIKSPVVIRILTDIREMRRRLRDPDLANQGFAVCYQKLSEEFDWLFRTQHRLFMRIVEKNETAIQNLLGVLYYQDQVYQGKKTEREVADIPAKKYLPAHLKDESDRKLAEIYAEQDSKRA